VLFSQVDEWLSEWHARESETRGKLARWVREMTMNNTGRFIIGAAPVVLMSVVTALLMLTGEESFAELLSFLGTVAVPLIVGIFPVLLLAASRRKGDYVPAAVFSWLGHPVVIIGLYVLFLGSIFIDGLIVWQDPFQRVSALIAGTVMLGMTLAVIRRGAFKPRAVVEVRVERNPEEEARFSIASNGKPVTADVRLQTPDGETTLRAAVGELGAFAKLRSATFQLPSPRARELKVWTHQITPQGTSQGLTARLTVISNEQKKSFEINHSGASVFVPLDTRDGSGVQVQIEFS
jgi:hypothetical protein